MENAAYKVLYAGLIYEMHHKFGAHIATIEGLFNIIMIPEFEDHQKFKQLFEQLRKDKLEMTERYNLLEQCIEKEYGGS